ncbi:MAG: ribosome recycling factor [Pseudomonadota bacterium]
MSAPFDLNETKRKMQASIASLKSDLTGLRTGRASANLLDPIMVEAYGNKMPLREVGSISVPEARMISVQVWDKALVSAVDKAVRDANLGLNPSVDGQLLRITIPELTSERRQELVKLAHKYAEAARVAVRHVRRDAMDALKKMEKSASEDEIKRQSELVQKATDESIGEVDKMVASKEKDITQV